MNIALKILLIADGISLLIGAMLGPIYAIFVEKIGGDILTAGSSFALFSLVMGLLILLLGKIEDIILKETELWICVGYLITAIAFFGYCFVKSPLHLFLVQIILGIGGAISAPAYSAVYSKHLDPGKYAFQWGAWEAVRNFSTALGALTGAILATIFGFKFLFLIMGTFTLISSVIIYFTPRHLL
jgi:MFS family permease